MGTTHASEIKLRSSSCSHLKNALDVSPQTTTVSCFFEYAKAAKIELNDARIARKECSNLHQQGRRNTNKPCYCRGTYSRYMQEWTIL